VDGRDREQGTDCLNEQTCPFDKIDLGLAYNDSLPTRIQCVCKCADDFTLCDLLALTGWRVGKGQLQRLDEGAWRRLQRGRALSHPWPFLSCGFFDVTTDQVAQVLLGVFGKIGGEHHDGSQRTRLAIDGRIRPFVIVPYLCSGESDEKSEDDT
jgi:hypothetical protein